MGHVSDICNLCEQFGESAAFVRSDDPVLYPESEYPEKLPDSTSGPGSPDLEFFTTPLAYKVHMSPFIFEGLVELISVFEGSWSRFLRCSYICVTCISFEVRCRNICTCMGRCIYQACRRPTSSGSVLLKSSDPWEQPSVNPKYAHHQHTLLTSPDPLPSYLQTPEDAAKLLRGVRTLLKIAQTEPLAPLLDQDFKRSDLDHELHLKSDAELKEAIKERVETVYHPTTTCRMAPAAEDGVVDSQLRVYGVRGLRVCDASIFPWIISGHTVSGLLPCEDLNFERRCGRRGHAMRLRRSLLI